MVSPHAARSEELVEIVRLINRVFRQKEGWNPTMQEEFPLLLCEENKENIRVLSQNRKPVSVVSFLERTVLVEGTPVKVASVGAVCTEEAVRGQGYSSRILDDVEQKAVQDGVDLLLVSGTRGLYRRRNCSRVQPFYAYTFLPRPVTVDFTIRAYTNADFPEVMRLYHTQATRFVRTEADFAALIKATAIPFGSCTFPQYVLERADRLIGYLFLAVSKTKQQTGSVREAGGAPGELAQAFGILADRLALTELTHMVHRQDVLQQYASYDKRELGFQEGTVKILNFPRLMAALQPYFLQYLTKEEWAELLADLEKMLAIYGLDVTNRLVLGGESPLIFPLLQKVFPIPFPHLSNLNYQ